jgi:lipoyl-dependent peroxiredoxin
MKRNATAVWNGTIKDGKGTISTQSGVLEKVQYSFKTRFEEGQGTNPEELIAAAHAGCFTMKLSAVLTEAGITADELETKAYVTFENGSITESHLVLNAKIQGIDEETFQKSAANAKENCPISKLLNTNISLEATLNQ